MKILIQPCDLQGCGTWRIRLPVSVLQRTEETLDIKLSDGIPTQIRTDTGEVIGLSTDWDFDVLVVQRPMADWQVRALKAAKRKGVRTVVEVDDDFYALHVNSPAWTQTHPNQNWRPPASKTGEWNRRHLSESCRIADLVTVTTPALARRYAAHGRYVILPNYVPESWLALHPDKAGNVVGWTGTVATHRDDLQVTHGGVASAVEETGSNFRAIGRPELVRENLGLAHDPEVSDWADWDDYPREVARLDVGIAPLADTAFNRAKSWLKALEYAALGVPCVLSPLPEYEAIHRLGVGLLARDRAREWRREIKALLTSESYREEKAASGREVAGRLTIEEHAWRWAEVWIGATVAA